jgi:hypothetical protein
MLQNFNRVMGMYGRQYEIQFRVFWTFQSEGDNGGRSLKIVYCCCIARYANRRKKRTIFLRLSKTCVQHIAGRCEYKSEIKLNLKMRTLRDIAPCSLVGVDRRFRRHLCDDHSDDVGSTHLWNVGLLRNYTALYPIRLSSSYSLSWEYGISRY